MKKLSDIHILVVGDVMLDRYWYGDATRISPEAPVPVVKIESEDDRLGGAANVAANIRSLGVQVSLITSIGDDEAGHKLHDLLDRQKINIQTPYLTEVHTTIKLRVIASQQQVVRVDFEDLNSGNEILNQFELFNQQLSNCQAIVFSDYGKGGLSHIKKMIEIANSHGIPVFVDPKGSDYSAYYRAHVITPNKKELMQVIGEWKTEKELENKAQKLRMDLGLKAVLLTRSEEGMTLFSDEGSYTIGTVAKEVFDVSGAGDTVIAVFSAMIAAGYSMKEAMRSANKAAGFVVARSGTAIVSRKELFGDRNV